MLTLLRRFTPQPLVAAGSVLVSSVLLVAVWLADPRSGRAAGDMRATILTLLFVAALLLSYQFPIHIRLGSKVYMSTVVYYLMATLLPLPLAVAAAGLGCLAAEISVRARTGNYPSDIATQASRMVVIVGAGSLVAHLPLSTRVSHAPLFILAATSMLILEHVTAPALFWPITGEPPLTIIRGLAREGGLGETAQYVLGLLGAFAAQQETASLVLLGLPAGLIYVSFKRAKDLDDGTRQTLESIADTVDLRDPYTGGHSRRVTEFTRAILQQLDKSGPEVDLIIWAARVHDIGKIAIPDGILNKPGKLTDEERTIMESHAEKGAEFLGRYPQFARGVEIVRHHHESWDGTGYPHRLHSSQIPFGSRVIAVADSFDAMTSDRPYRAGMLIERAANILREGRGVQWDGTIVDALLRSLGDQLEQPVRPALSLVPSLEENLATA